MGTTFRGARNEKRVGGDTSSRDRTTQTALYLLALSTLVVSNLVPLGSQRGLNKRGSTHAVVEEDGISSDDAPEVALEDIDEVCALSSNDTVGSLISEYFN